MNNVPCSVIQDLLPLYCDGVCSEESKKLVQAHIADCETCAEELCLMNAPMAAAEAEQEVQTARAASRAWKKNRHRGLRTGILLTVLLALAAAAVLLGLRYGKTNSPEDLDKIGKMLESEYKTAHIEIRGMVQKGDYLAVSGCDGDRLWHLGIFKRDAVFSRRWVYSGGLIRVKPGNLANWNYETPEGGTILVCFGAELPQGITGYQFSNSGVTYTCSVTGDSVLDFFFMPDTYDSKTHLEPIYQP